MSVRSQQKVTFQHFLPPGGTSGKRSDLAKSLLQNGRPEPETRSQVAHVPVVPENQSLASYKNILLSSLANNNNNNNNSTKSEVVKCTQTGFQKVAKGIVDTAVHCTPRVSVQRTQNDRIYPNLPLMQVGNYIYYST